MLNTDHRNSLGNHTSSFWASAELSRGGDHLGLLLRGHNGTFVKVCEIPLSLHWKGRGNAWLPVTKPYASSLWRVNQTVKGLQCDSRGQNQHQSGFFFLLAIWAFQDTTLSCHPFPPPASSLTHTLLSAPHLRERTSLSLVNLPSP